MVEEKDVNDGSSRMLMREDTANSAAGPKAVNTGSTAGLKLSKSEHEISQRAASMIRERPAGRWTLSPENQAVKVVEIALALALVYTAIFTPVEVAFIMRKERLDVFFWMNLVANVAFLADLALQFFTHFRSKDRKREWVKHHPSIVKRYVLGYFLIDLISSFPYDVLALFVRSRVVRKIAALRLLRLLRLFRLLRIAGSLTLVSQYRADMETSFALSNLLKYLLVTVFMAHYFACIWGAVANASSTRNSWHSRLADSSKFSINTPKNQYLVSLYFVRRFFDDVLSPLFLLSRPRRPR